MLYGYRRASDGVISDIQMTPLEPTTDEKTARTAQLNTLHGGTWEYVALDSVNYNLIKAQLIQGRGVKFLNGEVLAVLPPVLTSDKSNILPNGTDKATITINVNDVNFAGAGKYWINPPEETPEQTGLVTFVAGVGTLELATQQIGAHVIRIDVTGYGTATIEIEGAA